MDDVYETPVIYSSDNENEVGPVVSPVVVLWLGAAVYGAAAVGWYLYLAVHQSVVVTN